MKISSENRDLSLYDDNFQRRRNSSLGSVGSVVMEEMIVGAVMQEAAEVLGVPRFNRGQEATLTTTIQTTSTFHTTTTTTTATSNANTTYVEQGERGRSGM